MNKKMRIKKNDKVIVITGKDKGKTGEIVKVFPSVNKVLVSGVNIKKVHIRARRSGEKGQIAEKSMPIDASNVMLVDSKTGKRTRIGSKMVDGKRTRIANKSQNVI
jgi:large subunit ribosomal protein L24